MLIKIEDSTIINMTGVRLINLKQITEVKKISKGWFDYETKEEKHWNIEIRYINEKGKDATFTLTHIKDIKDAMEVRDSVLSQIKEVEMERLSNELENAIRNS